MTVSQKYIFVEAIQLTWSLVSKIRIGSHEHSFSFLLNLGGDMGLQNHRGFKGTTQQNTCIMCPSAHAVSLFPSPLPPTLPISSDPATPFPCGYHHSVLCVYPTMPTIGNGERFTLP